ncbi:energy-coupling factor ABC transporter ATP-binding protein [Lactobacillus sp. PV034]|uniref:energy-coupling factor ABC transporter ATP-binding protein n=1 Tax=Lactobacillus sp. PV034 TaxID=2594495 RepID=UPI00223F8095|nr:ABC transporter ATP-binding protein [Lactobacillus sp. PV034]QNQ80921.1 ABC transporter ATP-binding protein [Lactobacillus sp. PV034]
MIEIKNGSYYYTSNHENGITDINLRIDKGEAVGLMGPNGSGKSTLLKILVGIYALEEGSYRFNDLKIDKDFLKNQQEIGKLYQQIGLVFQNSEIQLFNTSVYEEIAFGPRNLGLNEEEVKKRTEDCLDLLKINKLRDRIPYHLSGGEQKLVAIASVLSMNPNVIIFDEPFNGLSPKYSKLVTSVIRQLNEAGKTIIISSHNFLQIKDSINKLVILSEDHTISNKVDIDELDSLPNIKKEIEKL